MKAFFESSEGILSFFLSIILIFIPLTRFLWDSWSQYLFFIAAILLAACAASKDLLVDHALILPRPNIPLVIFILFFAISSLLSPFKEATRIQAVSLFTALALFFAAQRLNAAMKVTLQKILCVTISLISLFYILTHCLKNMADPVTILEFFINHNTVASVTLLGFFISLSLYKESTFIFGALSLLTLTALILTKSIAGLLGTSLAVLYIFKQLNAGWNFKKIIFPVTITVILLAAALFFNKERTKNSFSDRIGWWALSTQMISSKPLFGFGPGSYEKVAPLYAERGLRSLYAHNAPLQMAAEMGFPAVMFLALFIITQFKKAGNIFLKGGMIAILFQNLFDYSMLITGIFILFLIISELAVSTENVPKVPLHRTPAFISYAFILPVLVFSGWRWGVKPLMAEENSLNAKVSFDKMDWQSAEKYIRKSIELDDLPAKYYSDLSLILTMRFKEDGGKEDLIKQAILMQKEALRREPLSGNYRMHMDQLLRMADTEKAKEQLRK